MNTLNNSASDFSYTNLNFTPLNISYYLSQIKPEGKIVYEYNPFRNFRLSKDKTIDGTLFEAGSVVDLDTELLQFSLEHPVDIITQPSYDGSVNLIFNDNKNIPRLINSRFSVLQNNTYEIVDRIGNNDTNLYDDDQFDLDSSLYKRINTILTLSFTGVLGYGNLKVGNYVLYFKYADADDNETDFVAESGIISCFIGNDGDPFSVEGGLRNQNSNKSISFYVSDIDSSYDYLKVYYTRTTSDADQNSVASAYKINKKYPVRNGVCTLTITGDEDTDEIPISDINVQYLIADKVKAQTVCQNMLFMGNFNKPDLLYQDLSDISLRILPYLEVSEADSLIGNLDSNYVDISASTTPGEYYNTQNIYNYVGYWNEEMYRLGVVYVMKDGSLSPVYNIRGKNNIPTREDLFDDNAGYLHDKAVYDLFDDEGNRSYISVDEETFELSDSKNYENSKGVIKIDHNPTGNSFKIYSIGIFIPIEVADYLKDKVKGLFIVRQKRIPIILAQAYVLPRDRNSELPVINAANDYKIERFMDNTRILNQNYTTRLMSIDKKDANLAARAAICPEYSVNQAYYNMLFTGTQYVTKNARIQPNKPTLSISPYNERCYYTDGYKTNSDYNIINTKIVSVADGVPIVAIEDHQFRARAGEAEEAFRFRYAKSDNKKADANNLVRGLYGPYLGITGEVGIGNIINIYTPGYTSTVRNYFSIRYDDDSPYYAIGDRVSLESIMERFDVVTPGSSGLTGFINNYYRGDCYICNYTHRLNRNFQDPDAPTNDEIVDENTWKDNYSIDEAEKNSKINRGDVNAIKLGSWITVKYLSTTNLSIRSLDPSYPAEEGLTGLKRGFYPLQEMSVGGNYKIPESSIMNKGFTSTVGEKVAFTLPDVPYIKNRFDTRIIYSDVSVGDAFKNGLRVFQFTHYRDYPRTYGGIMKMVELFGNILCIFEHGVALIPVNERAVAGEGSGGNVFINTSNVLPENPKMLSDTFGTQWPESVIKTPYYIYGVDTVGKKIWRTNGSQFEVISDFKIQQFLNRNISLSERELTPIIGVRNVKSHYNAFKQDVMFTFYDNLYGFEEKVWNICYNEVLQKWITFYSWVPSYSENIDNLYFSFNRDTSKWITKLALTNAKSNNASGVTLSDVVFTQTNTSAELGLTNRPLPNDDKTKLANKITISYSLERDNFQNYKKFEILQSPWRLRFKGTYAELTSKPVWLLNIKANVDIIDDPSYPDNIKEYVTGWRNYTTTNYRYYQSTIAVTSDAVVENPLLTAEDKALPNLSTDFWKHGQSGIIDIKDRIKPTYWYGKQHPFEFEFVVVDNPSTHKIFNNLQLISNKAQPESFHYEIVGEVYDFSDDKISMYYRQEATKEMYQNLGSDILFDNDYTDLKDRLTHPRILNSTKYVKSTMLPTYYTRVDTFNEIEDFYHRKDAKSGATYMGLSGTEVVREDLLNEFRLWTHSEALDIQEVGRLRGNINYQEDKWDVQIPSIIFIQKNEDAWPASTSTTAGLPPIVINHFPEDITKGEITDDDLPADYKGYKVPVYDAVDVSFLSPSARGKWTDRKEVRPKDKYIKIRVRYSGEDLAIITALKTFYTISYA